MKKAIQILLITMFFANIFKPYIMKPKIVSLLSVFIYFSSNLFSQSLGLSFSPTQYSTRNFMQNNLSINNVEDRYSLDMSGYLIQPMTNNVSLSVGFSFARRVSEMDFSFSPAKVSEVFYSVPFKIVLAPETTNKTKLMVGFGLNFTTIFEQKFMFADNITIPTDFNTEYGFGSYTKIGFITELGLKREISEGFYSYVSIGNIFEPKKTELNKKGNPANFYTSTSINIGIETRIFRKKDE